MGAGSSLEDDAVVGGFGLLEDDAGLGFGLRFDFSNDDSVEEGDNSFNVDGHPNIYISNLRN